MRSRIAITALLAMGALMSSGGAALGVSALSTDTDASSAQYGPRVAGGESAESPSGGVLGSRAAGGGEDAGGEARGASPGGAPGGGAVSGVQAARQLGAEGQSELPFTGYAAIPLLLVGLALLIAGLTLRRSTRRASAQL